MTFKIKNSGPSPHDIGIKELNKASEIIDPGKSGELTGYHWGITRKQALLGWETGRMPHGHA